MVGQRWGFIVVDIVKRLRQVRKANTALAVGAVVKFESWIYNSFYLFRLFHSEVHLLFSFITFRDYFIQFCYSCLPKMVKNRNISKECYNNS